MLQLRTLCAVAFPFLSVQPVVAQEEPDAYRVLFDGSTLDGWRGDPGFWYVRDGAIVGESTEVRPCKATTSLVWEAGELADFELRLEVRMRGGNSGVHFRAERVGEHSVSGYQAEIAAGGAGTGSLYEEGRRGVLAQRGQRVRMLAGGGNEVESFDLDDDLRNHIRPGEWNHYLVRAVGGRIELGVNGHMTCEVLDEDPEARRLEGLLALQLHAGPPMRVEFRNVRLRELPRPEAALPVALEASAGASDEPEWIWSRAEAEDLEQVWVRKEFELAGPVRTARLLGACDNLFNAYLNGELVASGERWWEPIEIDVDGALREGRNVLAVWGQNEAGPAAMWFELEIGLEDGSELIVVSDSSWSARGDEVDGWNASEGPGAAGEGWASAHSLGGPVAEWPPGGTAQQPEASTAALPAEELELPAGFRAELLYSVPRESQGSWVCLALDGSGNLIASDQYGALYRVVLPRGGGEQGVQVERLEIEVGEAQGLLWAFDSLYAVVNGHGRYESGLYRVRDTDGDGRLDHSELLKSLDGRGEHGPHAVLLAPDGNALYVIAGNHTRLPEGLAHSRVPEVWQEDVLLPRINDPGGHAVGVMAPGGWVCRTDPDGKDWELIAAGMRNAYDIAFDVDGELFTFDSDMEWDVGLPWYRPTRILHLVSGADYGWRHGSGKWPVYFPDSYPGAVDIGLSSPTGVTFGTGASFPRKYQRALYSADWAYGTLYAVHLTPDGASYGGDFEPFVRGEPFPVTDVVIGHDGVMYITTGGRRVQSGLYSVRWLGAEDEGDAGWPGLDVLTARNIRRSLEKQHTRGASAGLDEILPFLGDPDRFLRSAARVALEHREPREWLEPALALNEPLARIQVAIAVAHGCGPEQAERTLRSLLRIDLGIVDEDVFLGTLRAIALVCLRLGEPEGELRAQLVARLEELYPTGRERSDRELARLLVHLGSEDVVHNALAKLASTTDQGEALYYAYVLRTARGWSLEDRRAYFDYLNGPARELEGGNSLRGYVERVRVEAIEQLPEDERLALADWLEPRPKEVVTAVPAAITREGAEPWKLADLLPHVEQVESGRAFEQGEAAFESATCLDCHRIGQEGGSTGPDLTGAAGRFNTRDLLEALLDPSKVISDQYQDTELLTEDEQLIVGRVMREEDGVLTLLTMPPTEEEVEIDVATIVLRRPHPLSRMPEGLVDGLTREQVLDLLAYTLAGGSSSDSAFRTNNKD